MARHALELSALSIKRAAHSGKSGNHEKLAVGGAPGLMLQITATGAKSWILRATVADKRREIGIGPYPEISLSEARERARQMRAQIINGSDPVLEKQAVRSAIAAEQSRTMIFKKAVGLWIVAKGAGIPDKRRAYIKNAFARYAHPVIGQMAVHEITPQDISRILAPIWAHKHETASKLRMRLEAVLAWATVSGYRTGDNPARWGGNLKELLPSPEAVHAVVHRPALARADLPRWWAELGRRNGMGARALRFLALTATRSGEVRGATWDEIDTASALWVIPKERMKSKREHRVPLTPAALALLEGTPRMAGSPYIFSSTRGGQLSDMTLGKVMRDMQEEAEGAGLPGWLDPASKRPAVPHGLRSSFRDWCADTGVDRDLAELCLAHAVGSDVERAYRRTDMIERRRAVMAAWGDVLEGRERETVVPFPVRAA